MIFFYTGTGDLINKTPPVVYQGSSKANTIYFVCPTSPKNLINVAFKLPNGESTPQALMTLTEDTGLTGIFDVKGNIFALWKYDIPSAVTAYKGNVTVQFYISSFDEVLATESATITVQKGVSNIEPEYGDTYQEVINFLVGLSSEISDLQNKELNIENLTYETEDENDNVVIVNTGSIATKKGEDKNTGKGRFGATFGSGNIMNAHHSLICSIGSESVEGGQGSVFIAGGNSNKVAKGLASAIGHNLRVNTDAPNGWKPKIGMGLWNKDVANTVLLVGNGTSEEDRRNAFEVYYDGHAELQEQGETDNSVVIKKHLTEELAKISGGSDIDLSEYVKFTDTIGDNKLGVIRFIGGYGLQRINDYLLVQDATNQEINQNYPRRPITAKNLDYAIVKGLTTNTNTMTDEQKALAQAWLGVNTLYNHHISFKFTQGDQTYTCTMEYQSSSSVAFESGTAFYDEAKNKGYVGVANGTLLTMMFFTLINRGGDYDTVIWGTGGTSILNMETGITDFSDTVL